MKEIDLNQWDRKEHFLFFSKSELPFYNVSFNVDITGLKEFSKREDVSINNVIIYLTIRALSQIKNFLYRIENGKIVEYESLDPSFTCLKSGEELFRLITLEYSDNVWEFDKIVKQAIQNSTAYFDLSMIMQRSNFVFISTLPWIPFTGIDHTLSLRKEDAIPRVSWGKFFKDGERVKLPYNIQVNHMFVDGFHVGKFYEKLDEEIAKLQK